VAPDPQLRSRNQQTCARAPRAAAPRARAPAVAGDRRVKARVDLIRAHNRRAAIARVAAVRKNRRRVQAARRRDARYAGHGPRFDQVAVVVDDADDLVLLVQDRGRDLRAEAHGAREGHEVVVQRTVARVAYRQRCAVDGRTRQMRGREVPFTPRVTPSKSLPVTVA
jgi:hypothetical protein